MPHTRDGRKGSAGTMAVSEHYIESRNGREPVMRTVLTAMLVAAALPAYAQRPPNLSGHWVMRAESLPPRLTDTAAARLDSVRADSIARPPARGGTRRGVIGDSAAGRPGNSTPRRFGPSPAERLQIGRLLGMAQAVPSFTLAQSDTAIVVTNEDGFSYTLHLDGRWRPMVTGSDTLRARARWQDGVLVAEYEPKGGGKLTERYHLADSRVFLRLEVTVDHKGLMRPVWQPRIYRKVTDTPSPT